MFEFLGIILFYYMVLIFSIWFWLVDLGIQWSGISTIASGQPTPSATLVPKVFVPLIFPIGILNKSSLKRNKPWTKPTGYEVDHKIKIFNLKQKIFWKLTGQRCISLYTIFNGNNAEWEFQQKHVPLIDIHNPEVIANNQSCCRLILLQCLEKCPVLIYLVEKKKPKWQI